MPWDGDDIPTRRQIRTLATERYDGDYDAAYRAVVTTGLDSLAIPDGPGCDRADGDLDRIHYTELNDYRTAGLCLRFFPTNHDQLYTGGSGPEISPMDLVSFYDAVAMTSRYNGVNHEDAVFSIADEKGHWYGWGFSDFLTALERTDDRYHQANRTPETAEDCYLLFRIDTIAALVHCQHDIATNRIENLAIDIYAPGIPFEDRDRLGTIAAHFGGSLRTMAPFESYETGTYRNEVEPVAYLTEDSQGHQEWVSRIVIHHPPSLATDSFGHYERSFPTELVCHLRYHVPLRIARDCRYWIERYAIAHLNGGIWNVTLEGNWERGTTDPGTGA